MYTALTRKWATRCSNNYGLRYLTHSYRSLCRTLTKFCSTFVHFTALFTDMINQQMNVVKYVYE
jgi:hypothetical protein